MQDIQQKLEDRLKQNPNHIIAKVHGMQEPKVIESTHRRFGTGANLDYSFLKRVLFEDNYSALLLPQNETNNYTIVERYDPNDRDIAMEVVTVEMSNVGQTIYGQVKETTMGYNNDWWIKSGELIPDLTLGKGAYLLEVILSP